jgi:hypothetical protein
MTTTELGQVYKCSICHGVKKKEQAKMYLLLINTEQETSTTHVFHVFH